MKARNLWGGPVAVLAVVLAAELTGCMNLGEQRNQLLGLDDQSTDSGGGTTQTIDSDETTLAILSTGAYHTSADFTHVSSGPYTSAAVSGAFVDLWVSTNAYADYAAITPNASGSGAVLPLGAIIVRAVSDASGNVTKLTLMRHGPAGINPMLDDWWFAETDPNGVPLTDDAGPLTGPLAACMSCHLGRMGDDYLFGVPAADR